MKVINVSMFKFFKKFSSGLSKTTNKLFGPLGALFKINKLDDKTIDEIEKSLYSADFGVKTTQEIIIEIKDAYKRDKSMRGQDASEIAANIIKKILSKAESEIPQKTDTPQVICLVGVNGSGKTTTAAKLAQFYKTTGHSVLLSACDTFRAAAGEQIQIWAKRLDIDIVKGQPGGDAAAIAYDAYQSALSKKQDIVIVDTAGRLHVKSNLMQELKKIEKILKKIDQNVLLHNWLVVDGGIGSNSIESAKTFNEEIKLNGLVVTKLDGTCRGGAIVGIHRELELPILFIGTGEKLENLTRFSTKNYVNTLFKTQE